VKDLVIEKQVFKAGENGIVKIGVGRLPSGTKITLDAHVYRGKKKGPTSLVLAGVHGDEINGVEIVRRLIYNEHLKDIKAGSIIVIPLLDMCPMAKMSIEVFQEP